jgi:hypothetical protein
VGHPAGVSAFYIRTLGGRVIVEPDASILIDLAATPPRVRAVGGAAPIAFMDNQVPAGAVDGVNRIFNLISVPAAGSLHLHRNGLLLKRDVDYTLSGSQIQFMVATTPTTGSILLASYRG